MVIQSPPIDNVLVAETAVADFEGMVTISFGLGSDNELQTEGSSYTGTAVSCTTLPALLRHCGIDSLDFLKIDIEGSEPLLSDDLVELAPRVRSLFVEFSHKNTQAAYTRLLKTLGSHYAVCSSDGTTLSLREAQERLDQVQAHDRTIDFNFLLE